MFLLIYEWQTFELAKRKTGESVKKSESSAIYIYIYITAFIYVWKNLRLIGISLLLINLLQDTLKPAIEANNDLF